MSQKHAKVHRNGRVSLKRSSEERPMARLIMAVRDFKYILGVLDSMIGFRLPSVLQASVDRVTAFCVQQATLVSEHKRADNDKITRAVSLVHDVADDLYERFEAFLTGVFTHQDNVLATIRESTPELLTPEVLNEISSLQNALRSLIAKGDKASYEEIAKAYNDSIRYLNILQANARRAIAEQEAEMDVRFANELLKELAA